MFPTFSKRRKQEEQNGKPVVYQYQNLPLQFRNQVLHILLRAIGQYTMPDPLDIYGVGASSSSVAQTINAYWEEIFNIITNELGLFQLSNASNIVEQIASYLQTAETEQALDMIEISFHVINTSLRSFPRYLNDPNTMRMTPNDAIRELNRRFHEHSIGYQFVGGQLVKETSQFVHQQMVVPAINLLQQNRFTGANAEYLLAHTRYRNGDYSGAIVEANKSFESTMKTICDEKRWAYTPGATAKGLLKVLFDNGLISMSLQSQFDHLRLLLEAGAPPIRNRAGSAHGSGSIPVATPDFLAEYVLHMVATNIVFLVNAYINSS